MNCQDVLSRLYEIIDKEASAIDTAEVQQHLDRCRHCFDVYRLESAVQEFIHAKLKGNNPGTSLQTLKSQVLLRLDEIDRNAGRQESHRFFRRTAAVLAVAASLVILIGAGFLARDFYRHQTVYIPLERAHWASADKAETYRHEQNTSATIQGIHDRLSYDLLTNVGRYSLIGGRSEEVMDVSMAHFVYVQGDEVVSVFVAPVTEFAIPDDLSEAQVERGLITFYDHHCRGCRLVYHRAGSAVVITATTSHTTDLFDFVPGRGVI